MLRITDKGLYCPQGDFYIDPWRAVDKAIITHGHSDHARPGSRHYLAHHHAAGILRLRLGQHIKLQTVDYNQPVYHNGVQVSLHPAGHITGSAQIRLEYHGEVWVVSGDYKTGADSFVPAFEPVRCHTFITESTFGLPIYDWQPQHETFAEINNWWQQNRNDGITSILLGYSLGKSQRILAHLDTAIAPIITHKSIGQMNDAVRQAGFVLPTTLLLNDQLPPSAYKGSLILAPPYQGTEWLQSIQPYATAMASGWMAVRKLRRGGAIDKGFVLSDHADWKGLNEAVRATGAENVLVTHGYTSVFSRWLREQGYNAQELQTLFGGGEENGEGV